jgi:hypothetical protein
VLRIQSGLPTLLCDLDLHPSGEGSVEAANYSK